MDQIIIQTLHGLVNGMVLAMVASGLTLIFGIMDIVNFAHGDLLMLGAFVGASVLGVDFSDPKFHPVWAKAEELGCVLFIHPQSTPDLAKQILRQRLAFEGRSRLQLAVECVRHVSQLDHL